MTWWSQLLSSSGCPRLIEGGRQEGRGACLPEKDPQPLASALQLRGADAPVPGTGLNSAAGKNPQESWLTEQGNRAEEELWFFEDLAVQLRPG